MTDLSLTYLQFVYLVAIFIHLVAGFITVSFVIPLQVKEYGVKNGLIDLRRQLLMKGILSLIVIAVSVIVLSLRFVIQDLSTLRYIASTLVLIHSIGIVGKTYIDYQIYHFQYSEKNKRLHEMMDTVEKEELTRKG